MNKRHKAILFHVIAGTTIFLFISILGFHLYLKKNSGEIFISYLDNLLNKKDSIYKVKHNSIDVDLLGGQIVLKNLEITLKESRLTQSRLKQGIFVNATIPLLSIRGISITDLIVFRQISADRILLKNGKFKIYLLREKSGDKKFRGETDKLPSILLGGVVIENTDIEFFTDHSTTPKSGLKGISIDTSEIGFDHSKPAGKYLLKIIPSIQMRVEHSFITFKKNGYKAASGKIRFDTTGSSLSISDFRYEPASKQILNNKIARKGRYHRFKVSGIKLINIDTLELKENSRFKAGQIYIREPDLYFYRNRNINPTHKQNKKKLPQQIFRESPLRTDLGLIRIKDGRIKYNEIAVGENRSEALEFTELQSSFFDISNFPEILKNGKESEILVSTKVMGKSELKGKLLIPVNHRADNFYFKGSLSKTDPAIFNRFLKKNVKIKIDQGTLHKMAFNVKADRDKAAGTMSLAYNNLHLTLMRKKDHSRRSRFRTFLANTLTHKNNPTRRGKKLRTGRIQFSRKEKKSIFNYMWQCILSGIKSSIKI